MVGRSYSQVVLLLSNSKPDAVLRVRLDEVLHVGGTVVADLAGCVDDLQDQLGRDGGRGGGRGNLVGRLLGLLHPGLVEQALELGDAESSTLKLAGVLVGGAEAGDEVVVVALHDADVAGEQVDPGKVGVQAHSPVHLVVGQDRVVFASLVNLVIANTIQLLRLGTIVLNLTRDRLIQVAKSGLWALNCLHTNSLRIFVVQPDFASTDV